MSDLQKLQSEYTELYGKEPAARYKNDADWLRGKIDLALEKGVDEKPKATPKKTKQDVPADILALGEDIERQNLLGKFYSGDWEISIDNNGVKYNLNK